MSLEELQDSDCELEMTPMIDVTFLLLIFFMCTLKFKTLEGKLSAYLPKSVGVNEAPNEPIDKVAITVRVVDEGQKLFPGRERLIYDDPSGARRHVWDERTRVLEYVVANERTRSLEELGERLRQIHRQRQAVDAEDEVPATIDARADTCYGDIVPVLDAAIEAGFTDLTFVGAPGMDRR